MSVREKVNVVVTLAAVASLLLLGACHVQKSAPPAPEPPEVAVMTVHRGAVPLTIELPGRTAPYLVAQVRARVDGIVLRREFKEGSVVKANQRLYQIDPAPFRAARDSAVATLEQAQATLFSTTALAERDKILVVGNAVSKQDYDNAVAAQRAAAANVDFAKAAVETAKINLGYTEVVSPITGRSGISLVTQGAFVQQSVATLMTTVQQIDPIYVNLTQSSVDGLELRRNVASGRLKLNGPGQTKVTLILEDGTHYQEAGALEFSDITVDPGTGAVAVRAIFPNPRNVLLPGMFVRARIEQGVNDGAVLVPQIGVTHDPRGQATVLVVGPDDKVVLRTIQATRTVADNWVVEGGVADGDRVIVSGVQKAPPGTLVRTVAWQAPAAPGPQPAASNDAPATAGAAPMERLAQSPATK